MLVSLVVPPYPTARLLIWATPYVSLVIREIPRYIPSQIVLRAAKKYFWLFVLHLSVLGAGLYMCNMRCEIHEPRHDPSNLPRLGFLRFLPPPYIMTLSLESYTLYQVTNIFVLGCGADMA